MTVTTVEIYNQDGDSPVDGTASTPFRFDPVPTAIPFRQANNPGKMPLDLPSQFRPELFWSKSQARTLTIKTVVLGTDYTKYTILNWIDQLKYIMTTSQADTTSLRIRIPANENFVGSPLDYTDQCSDDGLENAMFSTGNNYIQFFCHPDEFTIDKVTRNMWFITLNFSESNEPVIELG